MCRSLCLSNRQVDESPKRPKIKPSKYKGVVRPFSGTPRLAGEFFALPPSHTLPPKYFTSWERTRYPKTYSPVYEALLAERFEQLLANPQAPVHRFMDRKKAAQFLAQPKDYGRPWFGQLMAGPQMIAYFLQVNDWMERYGIS